MIQSPQKRAEFTAVINREYSLEYSMIVQARRLIRRLERMSVDSYWAHQASGVRGALLRNVEQWEGSGKPYELAGSAHAKQQLENLVRQGYHLLENAAREYDRRR